MFMYTSVSTPLFFLSILCHGSASSHGRLTRLTFPQKMNALRLENDEANTKNEELSAKVKTLEQESLAKEQEITSLTHRNGLLEAEVEKLESGIKDAKSVADESTHHSTHNETLQRRLQLLEDEAEAADKNIRETNDK